MKTISFIILSLLFSLFASVFLTNCKGGEEKNHSRHKSIDSTQAMLGPKIGYGKGVIYEALLDNRVSFPIETNNKVKTGYLIMVERDTTCVIDSSENILFFNNNDFDIPEPTFDPDSIQFFEFDIYRLYIYGTAVEIALNLKIPDNITSYCEINISQEFAEWPDKIIGHENGNVHDPRPDSDENFKFGASGLSYEWGHLLGHDHIMIDSVVNYHPEILLFVNNRNNTIEKYDTVCYERVSVNIPGARIDIATDVVKTDDINKCDDLHHLD